MTSEKVIGYKYRYTIPIATCNPVYSSNNISYYANATEGKMRNYSEFVAEHATKIGQELLTSDCTGWYIFVPLPVTAYLLYGYEFLIPTFYTKSDKSF